MLPRRVQVINPSSPKHWILPSSVLGSHLLTTWPFLGVEAGAAVTTVARIPAARRKRNRIFVKREICALDEGYVLERKGLLDAQDSEMNF